VSEFLPLIATMTAKPESSSRLATATVNMGSSIPSHSSFVGNIVDFARGLVGL
jgi:hypothetical protein